MISNTGSLPEVRTFDRKCDLSPIEAYNDTYLWVYCIVMLSTGCWQGNEAIRYLEFCVQALGVRDQAIHNYLLSLYAKLQPDKLMKYLNFQGQVIDGCDAKKQ